MYRNAVYRRMKGSGKNPLGATLALVEFIGPSRFGGWETNGLPIAVPVDSSWVQLAAVAKDQTKNTTTLLPSMISPRAITEYGIEIGQTIAYAFGGRNRLEAVTSSPLALEGPRATSVMRDETHHWLKSNEGHAMAEVIDRNTAKSRDGAARVLSFTNAHDPAEDSVAQRDYEAYVQIAEGRSRGSGVLYDSIEAPPDTKLDDPDSLRAGLLAARGDSTWLDVERLMGEIWDPRTDPSVARRYYLNQIVAAEDAWVAPQEWDVRADPAKVILPSEDEITLGFDGSKSDDHSALVGCRISDSHLFTLGIWDPADYPEHEIPTTEVDAAVTAAFEKYAVVGFFSDVSEWESYIDKWEGAYGELVYVKASTKRAVGWDMRGRTKEITQAVEAFHDGILTEGALTHEGQRRSSQYVYNARRRPNQYGVTFGKEHRESSRKVDWLAGAVLARMARQAYLLLPPSKRRRKKTGRAMFAS